MNSLNHIDYVVIGIYMLAMTLIGLLLGKSSKTDKDYFRGGNSVPWPMAGMSMLVCAFSAYMFVGAAGQAYKAGIACLLLYTSSFYSFLFTGIFFIQRWRRTRITSPMEYIEMRYGPATRNFFTFLQIPVLIIGKGTQIYVLGIFISSALNITANYDILGFHLTGLHLTMILTGIIVVFYTFAGGLWAVIVTDTVQFLIVMIVSITIIPLSFKALGSGSMLEGISKFFTQTPPVPGYYNLVNIQQPLIFSLCWMVWSMLTSPGTLNTVQRAICVPDESSARKMTYFASLFFLIAPIIWLLPIFVMRPLLPDMNSLWPQIKNPSEASYVSIALMLLPHGMIGLTVSAILAATMSTLSAHFNIAASIVTRDIYLPYFNPRASDKQLLLMGRLTCLGFGLLAIIMGLIMAGYMDAFKSTYTLATQTLIPLTVPFAVGLVVRRLADWTAMVSCIACLVTTITFQFILGPRIELIGDNIFVCNVIGAGTVCFVTFIIGHLCYNPARERPQVQQLFDSLKKPVREDKDSRLYIPNLKMYRIVGWSMIVFGLGLIILGLIGRIPDPHRINLIVGLAFLTGAGLIEWFSSPRFSPLALVRRQESCPPKNIKEQTKPEKTLQPK